jgi:hypothetical protein
MASGVWSWSTTAASNAAADSDINYREGQAPSTLNNSGRAIMTAIKRWFLDLGGMLDTAGSGTAYTLTTNSNISTLTDGAMVACRLHAANGASPTLAVDGTAAKAITTAPGVAVLEGALALGSVQRFTYDQGSDEWRLNGSQVPAGVLQTGDGMIAFTSQARAGFVQADGRTIGSASSSATSRANADTSALFAKLWTDYSNTLLPIQDSAGSPTTRGANAAADFAANKRLPVPDMSGRSFAGRDNMSGTPRNVVTASEADTLGGTVGAETVTLAPLNMPNINPTVTDPGHFHAYATWAQTYTGEGGSGFTSTLRGSDSANTGSKVTGITVAIGNTARGGSQTAVNKMPPTMFGYVFIKL